MWNFQSFEGKFLHYLFETLREISMQRRETRDEIAPMDRIKIARPKRDVVGRGSVDVCQFYRAKPVVTCSARKPVAPDELVA